MHKEILPDKLDNVVLQFVKAFQAFWYQTFIANGEGFRINDHPQQFIVAAYKQFLFSVNGIATLKIEH